MSSVNASLAIESSPMQRSSEVTYTINPRLVARPHPMNICALMLLAREGICGENILIKIGASTGSKLTVTGKNAEINFHVIKMDTKFNTSNHTTLK